MNYRDSIESRRALTVKRKADWAETLQQHWYLFSRCLEVMSSALKRDMIGIRYPAMFQSEVENLEQRIAAAIEPHVRYACRFWADHLREGAGRAASLDVLSLFRKFVHKLVLYWIETCSLLDAMDKVIFALDAAQGVCQVSSISSDCCFDSLTLCGRRSEDDLQTSCHSLQTVADLSPPIHRAYTPRLCRSTTGHSVSRLSPATFRRRTPMCASMR